MIYPWEYSSVLFLPLHFLWPLFVCFKQYSIWFRKLGWSLLEGGNFLDRAGGNKAAFQHSAKSTLKPRKWWVIRGLVQPWLLGPFQGMAPRHTNIYRAQKNLGNSNNIKTYLISLFSRQVLVNLIGYRINLQSLFGNSWKNSGHTFFSPKHCHLSWKRSL